LERVRQGDQKAERLFFERFAPDLYALAVRMLMSRPDAEDVVQDTFVVAFEKIDRVRDPQAINSWILRIAVRLVHRRFRRTRLLRKLGLYSECQIDGYEASACAGADLETRGELALLERALSRLSAGKRVAWTLRYVEGMAIEEVAQACDCSPATVKRRIGRADSFVRAHLKLGDQQ